MFFLHRFGQLGGKFIYSTNTDMIHYNSTSVHDTTIDLLNHFGGELSLTNCLNWGKIVWVEEQQTSRCQFFADVNGTVTINHVWKIEMKMGCWHTYMLHIKYCHGLECFVMRLQTFGVSRIFTRLGARMAEHRTARQVFSRFWWKQRYNSVFKTCCIMRHQQRCYFMGKLSSVGLGNVFTSRSSEASPIHTCGPMHVPSIIDCPQQTHRLHSTAMVRLNGIAKKALHQYAIRTLGKSGQDKRWHVACSCQIDHHPNETNANALCPALSRIAWKRWQKLKLKVEQPVKSEQKNTLLRFEGGAWS